MEGDGGTQPLIGGVLFPLSVYEKQPVMSLWGNIIGHNTSH